MLDVRLDTHKFELDMTGHAGYAPAGQDIVCAGASMLAATLARALGGMQGLEIIDDGDRMSVSCRPSLAQTDYVVHTFSVIDCGLGLLANSYPNHVKYTKV